ncbi:DUF1287 domain-containing protein [Deltaproteobacteria bacterium OttesenSCG-928-K17]|nr:DUF1287 domain-containing protein [Deltaproteobacteria bacterium OttesenSCG-928-K17]
MKLKVLRYFSAAALLALPLLTFSGCAGRSPKDAALEKWWTENIPRQVSVRDVNQNGVSDTDDLIEGGRREVKNRPYYRSRYIENGGFPPSGEGVCTDLLWRAMTYAGYDFKSMLDLDVSLSLASYPRVAGQPDPNIDFRRVPNQKVFLERYGQRLGTLIVPGDMKNLSQWQAGDIVTFKEPDHVAIVSPKRNSTGVPYLIHNPGPRPVEADDLWRLYQRGRLTGHYRFPAGKH